MKTSISLLLIISLLFISCSSDDVLPKPKAYLRLDYPEASYQKVLSGCPYSLEISRQSTIDFEDNCWAKINYPLLNASIHLTYRHIGGDLEGALKEVEKFTYEHTIKADNIVHQPYENRYKKVYGQIINVEGDVASNIQFHVTDSVQNLLYGTLYFNVKPEYDSLLPAINYVEKDIKNLMESVEWKNTKHD